MNTEKFILKLKEKNKNKRIAQKANKREKGRIGKSRGREL